MGPAGWWRSVRARRNNLREMAALSSGSGVSLDDVGVSAAQFADMMRRPGRKPLWLRMAEALGDDARPVLRDVRRIDDLASRCAACRVRPACLRWLDGGAADGADVVRLCPNRSALARLPRRYGGDRGGRPPGRPRLGSLLLDLSPLLPGGRA